MAPRNMQDGRGQCARRRLLWAEKSAASGQLLPGSPDRIGCGKAWFYWVFLHGTALAEKHARRCRPPSARPCWSSAMFFALGAASSAIDALKALTSSKSSSAQSTGVSQNAKSPFDLMSSSSSASVGSGSGSGSGGGGSQISPQTMSALLDAQSQSSTGSATTASKSRSAALKDLFGQIDGDGDGTARSANRNSKTRSAPAAPTSSRPTACSASSTRTATARSASRNWRRR